MVRGSLVIGSYGTVHKAKNKETGRYVAIKKFIEDDQTTLKIAHREVNNFTPTSKHKCVQATQLNYCPLVASPPTITSREFGEHA